MIFFLSMEYNHTLIEHRRKLAGSVVGLLTSLGFKRDKKVQSKEHVYSRMLKSNMKISVYTSAINEGDGLSVRKVGDDAIRIGSGFLGIERYGVVANTR